MKEEIYSVIEYFEIEDGEKFCIQQTEDGEVTDQVLMERQVAIDLANDILNILDPIHI